MDKLLNLEQMSLNKTGNEKTKKNNQSSTGFLFILSLFEHVDCTQQQQTTEIKITLRFSWFFVIKLRNQA